MNLKERILDKWQKTESKKPIEFIRRGGEGYWDMSEKDLEKAVDIAILETLKEVEAIGFEFTNDKDLLGISKKELEKMKESAEG